MSKKVGDNSKFLWPSQKSWTLTKYKYVVFDKIHTCWEKSSYIFDYGGDDDSDTGGLWNLTLNYEG